MTRENTDTDHRIVLTHVITPDEQGSILEMPFEMPEDIEELCVLCEIGSAQATVDIGVADPFRVRGWSGSARTKFYMTRERATPGYLPGVLSPDRWAVLIGAYRIPPEGCPVTVTVECVPERPRWLRGDLHSHTVHSDGSYALAEVARIAEAAGLEFIGTTDHNTSSQNFAHPRDSPVVFIPAMELTTYRGHSNLFGVADPLTDFRARTVQELRDRLREARERGAKVALNHPHDPGCGWDWSWDVPFDWLEVWNGPWRHCNGRTLDWWQSQLVSGRRLVAIGGSDAHAPGKGQHGAPTTWVYSRSRSVWGILDAIARGHVFLSHSPAGPVIDLRCGESMMGDEATITPGTTVDLRVQGALTGDNVRISSEQGIEQELSVPAGTESVCLSWQVDHRRFYRAEIWRPSTDHHGMTMAAMSNPIYFNIAPTQ